MDTGILLKAPSVDEGTARPWSWHGGEPGSHWLNVTDTGSYEVIGVVQWIVHETPPYTEPALPFKAYWWPEGKYGSGTWRRKDKA